MLFENLKKLKRGVLNGPLIPRSGCLSRLVSPKLAHEAVLAKPPYFDEASAQWLSKMRLTGVQNVLKVWDFTVLNNFSTLEFKNFRTCI